MAKILQLYPQIPKGTIISCPDCGMLLHTFIATVRKGQSLNSNAVEPKPKKKAPMKCPKCQAQYGLVTEDNDVKLHTTSGWIVATA